MTKKRQRIPSQRSSAAANQRTAVLIGALAKVSPKRRDALLRTADRQPVVLHGQKRGNSVAESVPPLQLHLWETG